MPADTHFWAGNHAKVLLCQSPASQQQTARLPGPVFSGANCSSKAIVLNCSFLPEAFKKPQLLPAVEPCQGHQSGAGDTLYTQFGGFLLKALHNLSLWHIFLEHFTY